MTLMLDYVPVTKAFTLRVPRTEPNCDALIKSLMVEHGFDFSTPASNNSAAILFTREMYAAASFHEYATAQAMGELYGIVSEIRASWATDHPSTIACPADKELWPFQRADIAYALGRRHTLIGDQPGLGKTPVAICFANEIRAKRVLVVCPASIRIQWAKRIREWSTMRWPYIVHPILHGKHGVHPKAQWTVISYDLLRTEPIARALSKLHFDLLILDEAHYLKTPDASRTQALFGGQRRPRDLPEETEWIAPIPIARKAERILALSGTPLPNRPREAFVLTKHLCPDAMDFMSEEKFCERFNPRQLRTITKKDGTEVTFADERQGRHGELQNRLRANYMVRHMKRDVMTQLKMPEYDLIQVEETGPVKQALMAESLLDIDPDDLSGQDAEVLGHVATVRKMMGIAIAPQVADYVDMLIRGGEDKIVLFAWHIEVLNILQERLGKHGVVRIDGSTGSARKERGIEMFITQPNVRIIMGNLLSLGVGTDGLQAVAWHALIAEPDWTPGNNIQAFDRLDRGGQTRTVQGDIFVAPNSFAERVLASALRKNQTIHKALDRRM